MFNYLTYPLGEYNNKANFSRDGDEQESYFQTDQA
jgi:hypothetical protein